MGGGEGERKKQKRTFPPPIQGSLESPSAGGRTRSPFRGAKEVRQAGGGGTRTAEVPRRERGALTPAGGEGSSRPEGKGEGAAAAGVRPCLRGSPESVARTREPGPSEEATRERKGRRQTQPAAAPRPEPAPGVGLSPSVTAPMAAAEAGVGLGGGGGGEE